MAAELLADARTLWRLLRGQPRRGSHAESLQAFYGPQAGRYDAFRRRLLQGRGELIERLDPRPGERVVELGCGTGHSLDVLGTRVFSLRRLDLVDLCPALLDVARTRVLPDAPVRIHESDAATWRPEAPADVVFLSYALTMIPSWEATLENVWAMLAPGGRVGLVDFHLPDSGSRIGNAFWKHWFAHDGVRLSDSHLPRLCERFDAACREERRSALPYLPGIRAPYYLFLGRKGKRDVCQP